MGLPLLLVAAAAYLLGCSNGAVIVSKYISGTTCETMALATRG